MTGLAAILAGALGWAVGILMSPAARPGFIAAVAAVVAVEVVLTRPEVDAEEGAGRGWRRVELLAIVVGIPLAHAITGGPGVVGAEVVAGWVVALAVWLLVQFSLNDLESMDRGVAGEGLGPVGRIRSRLLTVGVATAAAEGLGRFVLGRADAGLPVATLAFAGAAMVAVGLAARAGALRGWRRNGARVDADVGRVWALGVVVTALVVLVTALTVAALPGDPAGIPARAVGGIGFEGWLDRTLSGGDPPELEDPGEALRPPVEETEVPPSRFPEWGGDAFLWLLVAAIFATAVAAARRMRPREVVPGPTGRMRPGRIGRRLLAGLRTAVARLVDWIRWLLRLRPRRAGDGEAGTARSGPRRSPGGVWRPADPHRARIAAAHREVSVAAGGRRPPETPREFGRRIAERIDGAEEVVRLTGLYERARYSTHALGVPDAEAAERAAAHVVRDLGPPEGDPGGEPSQVEDR